MARNRQKISFGLGRRILTRDGFFCRWCGCRLGIWELTFDHLEKFCLGGRSSYNNLVVACKNCNNERHNGCCNGPEWKLLPPLMTDKEVKNLIKKSNGGCSIGV